MEDQNIEDLEIRVVPPLSCTVYRIAIYQDSTVYVGASTNYPARHFSHLDHLRKQDHDNSRLQKAYNKFGEAALVFQVLEEVDCSTPEELCERERWWMHYALSKMDRQYILNVNLQSSPSSFRSAFKRIQENQ